MDMQHMTINGVEQALDHGTVTRMEAIEYCKEWNASKKHFTIAILDRFSSAIRLYDPETNAEAEKYKALMPSK